MGDEQMTAPVATSRRRWRRAAGAAAAGLALGGAVLAWPGTADAGTTVARATLVASAGNTVGRVEIVRYQYRAEVRVRLNVPASLAGFHGFHVHAVGVCDPNAVDPSTGQVSPFFSAGGHLSDGPGQSHRDHVGDMPPLYVTTAGEARATFITERLVVEKLFDANGSAIIVHYGPDNLAHIPPRYSAGGVAGPDAVTRNTGDAGPRLACGVLR